MLTGYTCESDDKYFVAVITFFFPRTDTAPKTLTGRLSLSTPHIFIFILRLRKPSLFTAHVRIIYRITDTDDIDSIHKYALHIIIYIRYIIHRTRLVKSIFSRISRSDDSNFFFHS